MREKERERNINVREKHQLVAFCMHAPNPGPGLLPRRVPWPGTEPVALWSAGRCSVHWETPVRAHLLFLWCHRDYSSQYEDSLGASSGLPNAAVLLHSYKCLLKNRTLTFWWSPTYFFFFYRSSFWFTSRYFMGFWGAVTSSIFFKFYFPIVHW